MKTKNPAISKRRLQPAKVSDVVTVANPLDAAAAKQVTRAVARLLEHGLRECIVDMSGVTGVDSAGFGILIGALRKIEEMDGSAVVVSANATVRRLFEIAGITRIVPLVSRVRDARDLFAGEELAS